MEPLDLYLGSEIGQWALEQVPSPLIKQVFTLDNDTCRLAQGKNITTWQDDANRTSCNRSTVGFCVHYPKLLEAHVLSQYERLYNLHPGYLPWGRGYYPVFWALWEGTPAGATLHEIVAALDRGPIVSQVSVPNTEHDTGGSLHRRVRKAEEQLFLEYWPRVSSCERIPAYPQPEIRGTYHTKKEFFALKNDSSWETMTGSELLRLIRCLTFPGYSGLEVVLGSRRFDVRAELLDESSAG